MKLGRKLLLAALGLLALPWLGYQHLSNLRYFLIQGQERTQLMAAQAVATSLQNRDELFDEQFDLSSSFDEKALYVHPLDYYIQIDGYKLDWEEIAESAYHFGAENIIKSGEHYHPEDFSFSLVLGQREYYLYALLEIIDKTTVYRNPSYRRLDNSDHIRIATMDDNAQIQRYILTTEGMGYISAYRVDRNWKHPVTGKPVPGVLGYWRESAQGYNLEFRLPLSLIGNHNRFDIAVADIRDINERKAETIIGTLPTRWSKKLNRIMLRSPELNRIITGLKRPGANIWIVDRHRRVRAHVADKIFSSRAAQKRNETAVQQALKGKPATQRFRANGNRGAEIIMAAFPIGTEKGILGAVVFEVPTDEILALHKKTLEKSATNTALVILAIVAGLLLFSSRLAYRIKRLQSEVTEIIDPNGRVHTDQAISFLKSADEIGDLSRAIDLMLVRLRDYADFLERMPNTLKHEINDPLNAISTSFQNLANCQPTASQKIYLESAVRGIARLNRIVNRIADAANLDDALRREELKNLNLGELLTVYVENCRHIFTGHQFELIKDKLNVHIRGNAFRIEQLLDGLIDNARELGASNKLIQITLSSDQRFGTLCVANEGPFIPQEMGENFIGSMASRQKKASSAGPTHLGIGLYVVRMIAEFHGGKIDIKNRKDKPGVSVTVYLPILEQINSS